ncbi:MAG: tetratricopeptide repeat protein [Proteobacteria bacterium]|nr:tetratricopeptide repeat protein [Pseudomonadota bacterium]
MGSKRVDFIVRRVLFTLLFFYVSVVVFGNSNEKAILNYTKAQYLAQEGKIERAEKLYIKAYKLSKNPEILSALIRDEMSYNRFKRANRWIREYEKNFEIDSTILKIKAVYFYDTGENDSLPEIYDKLYDLGERDNNFMKVYINEMFNNKKYDKSLKILNDNRDLLPEYIYYKNKAVLFNTLRDYDSSLSYFDSLKTLGDTFTNYVITGKAMVYESEGDLKKAISLYERLPGNIYVKDKLADLYYQIGEFNKLKGILDTLLYINPNNARYWRYMGRISEKEDNIQYAFAYYFTSQGLDSTEYLSCYFLGNLYTLYKDFNRSEIWYKQSVKRYPNFKDGYYKVVLANIQLSRTDSAWVYLNKALKRFTFNDTDYIYNLKGQLLYAKGKYDKAELYLLRFPNDEYDAVLLADVYATKDSTGKAIAIYRELIKKDSTNGNLYNNLGYTMAEVCDTCNLDTAEHYIDKAIEISPENPYSLDSKGYVLYKKGKYERAMDYYKSSLNLQEYGLVYYHMALVELAEGNENSAIKYIKNAMRFKNSIKPETYKKIVKLAKRLGVK